MGGDELLPMPPPELLPMSPSWPELLPTLPPELLPMPPPGDAVTLDLGLNGPPSLAKQKYKEACDGTTLSDNISIVIESRRHTLESFQEQVDILNLNQLDAVALVGLTDAAVSAIRNLRDKLQDVTEKVAMETMDDTLSSSFIPVSISRDNQGLSHLETSFATSDKMHGEAKERLASIERQHLILSSNLAFAQHSFANFNLVHTILTGSSETAEPVPLSHRAENRLGFPEELDFLQMCRDEEEQCRLAMIQMQKDRQDEVSKLNKIEAALKRELEPISQAQTAFSATKPFLSQQSTWLAQFDSGVMSPFLRIEEPIIESWRSARVKLPQVLASIDRHLETTSAELKAIEEMKAANASAISRLNFALSITSATIKEKDERIAHLSNRIYSVPEDVWRVAFAWCVEMEGERLVELWRLGAQLQGPRVPTTLSSVCRTWRLVALSAPDLWRYLVIPWQSVEDRNRSWHYYAGSTPFGLRSPRYQMLYQRHLVSSKGRELQLFFPPAVTVPSTISSFSSTSTSVECVYLGCSPPNDSFCSPRVLHCKGMVPISHTTLARTEELHLYDYLPALSQSYALLKALYIQGTINMHEYSVAHIIGMLPNLQSCTIHATIASDSIWTGIRHLGLRHLTLFPIHLSPLMTRGDVFFPNLARITLLDFQKGSPWILSALSGAFPSLHHLEFAKAPMTTDDQLLAEGYALMKVFPGLTIVQFSGSSLEFGLGVIFHSSSDPVPIKELRISDSATKGAEVLAACIAYRNNATPSAWAMMQKLRFEWINCPNLERFVREMIMVML